MAEYYPLFTDIQAKPVLVIGGNGKAYEKIQKLLAYMPRITVAADKFLPEIERLDGEIRIIKAHGEDICDLIIREMPKLVFLADTEYADADAVFRLCAEHRIELNTVDRQEYCSFICPSVIKRKKLTAAVSTSGASPAAAVMLREKLEGMLPPATDEILDWLEALRPIFRDRDGIDKRKLYRALAETAFELGRALDGDETEAIAAGLDKNRG